VVLQSLEHRYWEIPISKLLEQLHEDKIIAILNHSSRNSHLVYHKTYQELRLMEQRQLELEPEVEQGLQVVPSSWGQIQLH
jgi:hypothetical protein